MNATLSIKMELLEAAKVTSAADVLQLHSSQIATISVCLCGSLDQDSRLIETQFNNTRSEMQELVFFAQEAQPEGTAVEIWFQGRSERIWI